MNGIWVGILTVLLVIAALIVWLLCCRWQVFLHLKEKRLTMELRLWGMRMPLVKKDFSQKKPKKEKKTEEKPKAKPSFSDRIRLEQKVVYDEEKGGYQPGGIRRIVADYLEIWDQVQETFSALFDGMRYKIEVTNTELTVLFGTGNPAHTGMAYGAAWSALGVIYPILCRYFRMDYPQVELNADFETKRFQIEFSSIIKVRPVHIIHAASQEGWRMLVTYLRNKKQKGSGRNGRK